LTAVPDSLDLADFDDIFHTVLGWDSGIGYAFQVHGQEFNSFRRQTSTKKLRDVRLHRQEKFLYTLGAKDQWEWELRVVYLQDDAAATRRSTAKGAKVALYRPYALGPPLDEGLSVRWIGVHSFFSFELSSPRVPKEPSLGSLPKIGGDRLFLRRLGLRPMAAPAEARLDWPIFRHFSGVMM
jgi:hypothetical protein